MQIIQFIIWAGFVAATLSTLLRIVVAWRQHSRDEKIALYWYRKAKQCVLDMGEMRTHRKTQDLYIIALKQRIAELESEVAAYPTHVDFFGTESGQLQRNDFLSRTVNNDHGDFPPA